MTIKDLAAQTGYSVGTISRVLNNQPHVSELAREIILKAAADSGFQLNSNAKQLKQQHGTSILVICKGRANELFDTLLVAIQARVAQTQYPLIVDYIDESENEVRRGVQLCQEKKPRGILFLGGNQEHFLEDFGQISCPCVLVTNSAKELPFQNLSSVAADDVLAAKLAIEHLIALGHTRIGVIGGHRDYSDTTRLRYQGCLEAFKAHNISFCPELEYETAWFSFQEGYRAARVLLDRSPDLTAMFAMSDVMAIGAIRALTDAGRRVPEDVSIIGFDGLAIGDFMVPRLATMAQSVEELAQQSLDLLSRGIEDGTAACHETIPVTIVPGQSIRRI